MDSGKFRKIQEMFYLSSGLNLAENVFNIITFGDIKPKDIRDLNSWVKDHSDLYKMEKVILYHGTSSKHDIENEGIKKTSKKSQKSLQTERGYAYLSLYPESAKTFGSIAYPFEDISIYAVEVPIRDLLADHDQLRNKRLFGQDSQNIGKTLADSLVYGNGARVKRNIEAYEVRDVTSIINDDELERHEALRSTSKPSSTMSLGSGPDFDLSG